MKISEIYKRYFIPLNLQEHMLRVATISEFIASNWIGSDLDKNNLLVISLLHDIGNIVKFDLDRQKDMLNPNDSDVEALLSNQKMIIDKYGSDDHVASKNILKEIGLNDKDINIILDKSFGNCINTSKTNNWLLKILLYSDLRVLPHGIGTLDERFKDVMERMPKYSTRPDIEEMFGACRKIESQIQSNVHAQLSDLSSLKMNSELLNLDMIL